MKVCGAQCILRHVEGRYQRHEPDESSAAFDQACKLEDAVKELKEPEKQLVLIAAFDGIGGARRALELLGITPAVYISVEIDEDCAQVVANWWPEAIRISNIDELDVPKLEELLKDHPELETGIIIGGAVDGRPELE